MKLKFNFTNNFRRTVFNAIVAGYVALFNADLETQRIQQINEAEQVDLEQKVITLGNYIDRNRSNHEIDGMTINTNYIPFIFKNRACLFFKDDFDHDGTAEYGLLISYEGDPEFPESPGEFYFKDDQKLTDYGLIDSGYHYDQSEQSGLSEINLKKIKSDLQKLESPDSDKLSSEAKEKLLQELNRDVNFYENSQKVYDRFVSKIYHQILKLN